jgi:GR25 family glycosyltransferase involved in LPS biosynthesis
MTIKNFNDIKNVIYINLESRIDRKKHFENEIKKINLEAIRFNAILNDNGEKGCLLSHIRCLENAIENNLDHILIFEDDVVFTNPDLLIQQFNNFVETHDNWDVILLGGNNRDTYKEMDICSIKIKAVFSTVAYLVNGHYMKKLLNNFKESLLINKAVDDGWIKLQNIDNWYLIIPLSVNQLEGYSDILKKNVNYSDVMLKIKYGKK